MMRSHYGLITALVVLLFGINGNYTTAQDSSMPWQSSVISMCGCPACTPKVFDSLAGPYSCLERIQYLIFSENLTEGQACSRVGQESPSVCGKCNSATCRSNNEPQRIPVSAAAVAAVVPSENNVNSSNVNSSSNNSNSNHCGCNSCTAAIFNSDANGYSFSSRVAYLKGANPALYPKEEDACRQLAGVEFPNGFKQCDPVRCNKQNAEGAAENAAENAAIPAGRDSETELYCFPPVASRTTFDNVWGRYKVQVKGDPQGTKCGPGENVFPGKYTVSKDGNDLKLQFKKAGNEWQASEVRILLPDSERYQYGSYSFSVKSIRVIDSVTRNLISTVLPQSLVLGLFTWDPTEDYDTHENYNHEVDVEISRWNEPGDADAQFLVQPPGHPQTYRFFSGSDGTSFQQAPRIYGFDWRPTEIEWYSNAGKGAERFVYSTQAALDAGKPDYTQCMPQNNNVEVRINLWNLFGSADTPPGMLDTHVVEVVIDNFQFVPNGMVAATNNSPCSKDCQCGATSQCVQNKCTSSTGNVGGGGTRRRRHMLQEADSSSGSLLEENTNSKELPMIMLLVGSVLVVAVLAVVWPRSSNKRARNGSELPSEDPHGMRPLDQDFDVQETVLIAGPAMMGA